MAYETVKVRMNRSNASIPWGFSLRSTTSGVLTVASVDKESLAHKAGIEANDTVTELAGRNVSGMPLHEANNIIGRPSDEMNIILKRYITSHPTLPWNLTEQDNKIVVDQVHPSKQQTFTSSSSNTSGYKSIQDRKSERSVPIGYQPAPFTNVTNTDALSTNRQSKEGFYDSYSTESYTKKVAQEESRSSSGAGRFGAQGQQPQGMSGTTHNVPIALDYTTTQSSNYNIGGHTAGGTVIHTKPLQHTYTTPEHPASAPAPVPFSSGGPAAAPRSSHMIPVHINTGGYTSPPAAAVGGQKSPFSPYRHQTGSQQRDYRARSEASYYEEGPRVPFYHSPRTRRELSPSASIPHLYAHSRETPAEQYLRQTGGLFGTEHERATNSPSRHITNLQQSSPIIKPASDKPDHPLDQQVKGPPAPPAIPLPNTQAIPAPPPPPPAVLPSNTTSNRFTPIKPSSIPSTMGPQGGNAAAGGQEHPMARPHEIHVQSQQSPSVVKSSDGLTPQATIRHLQYNSPMNIYSMESAAEQYLNQTGGLFGTETDPEKLRSRDPSYLHSETRRLIEEEERGLRHAAGSPAQSSSFKRISAACGTPLE